jgi:hypothetical protein
MYSPESAVSRPGPILRISALFQNHKFGNWNEYVSKANAIPLKIMIDNAQFTLESVATAVEAQKIDDALFKLPPDTTLEKSPF